MIQFPTRMTHIKLTLGIISPTTRRSASVSYSLYPNVSNFNHCAKVFPHPPVVSLVCNNIIILSRVPRYFHFPLGGFGTVLLTLFRSTPPSSIRFISTSDTRTTCLSAVGGLGGCRQERWLAKCHYVATGGALSHSLGVQEILIRPLANFHSYNYVHIFGDSPSVLDNTAINLLVTCGCGIRLVWFVWELHRSDYKIEDAVKIN